MRWPVRRKRCASVCHRSHGVPASLILPSITAFIIATPARNCASVFIYVRQADGHFCLPARDQSDCVGKGQIVARRKAPIYTFEISACHGRETADDSPCRLGLRRPAWMAKPYAQDLRERRVRAGRAGQSRHAAARSFDVSASCGIKLMRQFETTE